MIRVAFDAFEWVATGGKSIGVCNYFRELLSAMVKSKSAATELTVLCNASNAELVRDAVGGAIGIKIVGNKPPGRVGRQLWQFGMATRAVRSIGATHYFAPRGYLPYGLGHGAHERSVVVCHDLIRLWYAIHAPRHFPWLEQQLLSAGALRAVRKASAVVAISDATAQEIRRAGTSRPVHVVHNGIPFAPAGDRPLEYPYLFAVTSALPHKNSDGLLAAYDIYRRVASAPLPLVICGLADPKRTGVSAVQGLSDDALHTYYAHATGTVVVSHTEGFGFPVVESMLHRTPVLCSDIPALREVSLGSALYADPRNSEAIAEGLSQLAAWGMRMRLPVSVAEQLRTKFSWEMCAEKIWRVLATS